MRVVLDTNVYIAAALRGELAEDVFRIAATTNLVTLIVSEEILTELQDKLENKFRWSPEDISRFLKRIRKVSQIVKIAEELNVIKQDPEDNKILECALSGKANLIVSLDQHLIKLKNFKGIGIVHPKTLTWILPELFKRQF